MWRMERHWGLIDNGGSEVTAAWALCHRFIGLPALSPCNSEEIHTFNAYYMSIYPFNWGGLLHIQVKKSWILGDK